MLVSGNLDTFDAGLFPGGPRAIRNAFDSLGDDLPEELPDTLAGGPLIRIEYDRGRPRGATGLMLVRAPADLVWGAVGRIERFPELIRMVDAVKNEAPSADGRPVVRVNLKFKVAFFGVRFHFIATHERNESQMCARLRYAGGRIRDLAIDVEVAGLGDDRSLLRCHVGFDPTSLGWLVKAFLKHHPEIEGGLHAGSVMAIADAGRDLAERRASAL